MKRHPLLAILVFLAVPETVLFADDAPAGGLVDLRKAVVVAAGDAVGPEKKAIAMLVEDVETKTGLRLEVVRAQPKDQRPAIVLTTLQRTNDATAPRVDGYKITSSDATNTTTIIGDDPRGLVFGVGRLLRELRMDRGRIDLPKGFQVSTTPKVALRGHQLGYRPKTNSYDAWDLPQWERYIRDLAIFGTNAIELVPPRTDDDAMSPHFPRPPLEIMVGMSKICDEYGIDVWVWFPVMDPLDTNPKLVHAALKEWGEVFVALPRLDAVFVPGGDPGHIPPGALLDYMEKATALLHQTHPKAQMWVSPQGFNGQGMEEFLRLVKAEPAWLSGIVFGPQVRMPLAELRKALPARYPIRGYPDITHSRQCQHPVTDWDLAFAVTEGRESVNPRPKAEAAILKAYLPDSIGFLTYSEGCNDDVNKFVWSALGWDPDADLGEILKEYSRVFISTRYAESFAQCLFDLERNWSGPLAKNEQVESTLKNLQTLEREVPPRVKLNWRFQQALYRGYYDAYIRDRLIAETEAEHQTYNILKRAKTRGTDIAVSLAIDSLNRIPLPDRAKERRARVFELAEALFQSIQMQLSKTKYQAIDPERGANLDTIDTPLNSRNWLRKQLEPIKSLATEEERLKAVNALIHRTDPGPGGFYDDLGDPEKSPHLVRVPSPKDDPLLVRAAFQGFALRDDWPVAWRQYAQVFYDTDLKMHYDRLDPKAHYRVRITYAGDSPLAQMRLEADGMEVHPRMAKPNPVRPLEFAVPDAAFADGSMTLSWTQQPGRGGNGRGCQVAEVWLIRAE